MHTSDDWRQRKFDDIFRQTSLHLRQRRLVDPGFSADVLARLLETQYTNEAVNAEHKSEIQLITDAATTAAYEVVLAEWRGQPPPASTHG